MAANDQPQSRYGEWWGVWCDGKPCAAYPSEKQASIYACSFSDKVNVKVEKLALSESTRVELGCPGHLIVASRCRWKRHTQVGNYRVSSIGDYYPDGDRGKRDTIGAGESSFFETLVFKTTDELDPGNEGCGCRKVAEWSEIDGERYATAGEAQAGHERYVEKYSRGER